MNYRSLSLRNKNIHINQKIHKIFWEAGNYRLKSHPWSSPNRDKFIEILKPVASIRGHYEILRILRIALFRDVFQKRKQCFDPGFWFISLTRCELNRVTIEMRHTSTPPEVENYFPANFLCRVMKRQLSTALGLVSRLFRSCSLPT